MFMAKSGFCGQSDLRISASLFLRLFTISEAEYTFRLRKDIVPLLLQPRYAADGWLGAMILIRAAHRGPSGEQLLPRRRQRHKQHDR